ncbi:hypothetical protein [Alkalihalophilus marmarensis]|uniref:hypothetical protein n=1 Tax=Alkalihalophilus marmarensis TaxID=521377 RepID=UPI002DB741A3|nr:hypothetical protein [Alkalihalophilus marmarensis]MEC2072613.1 hypothetical protein [Alkalihalophilus marmarensis]
MIRLHWIGLIMLLLLTGCSNKIDAPHFMWNDNLYIATNEPISEEKILKKIGEISVVVNSDVKENGEAKEIAKSTKLYQIEGIEVSYGEVGYIAYEMEGKYYVASKLNF